MENNLIVTKTIANNNDWIRLSCLYDQKKQRYSMPSLVIVIDDKEVFFADNDCWMTQTLLPALKRFQGGEKNTDDKQIIEGYLSKAGSLYSQVEAVADTVEILEYAIKEKMLYVVEDERSVATEA